MCERFIDKVRSDKIKQPIRYGFNIEKWEDEFKNIKESGEKNKKEDINIFLSGCIINYLLSEIRNELVKLYKKPPKITIEKLLMSYVSLANRDRYILSKLHLHEKKGNYHSLMISNNKFNSELTLQEIADGSVDSLSKAIFSCVKKIKNKEEIKPIKDTIELVDFVVKEAYLSQLYEVYESYWQGILWGDYFLDLKYSDQNIYTVIQNKSEYEVGSIISQIRKDRLRSANSGYYISYKNLDFLKNDFFIKKQKISRNKNLTVKKISSSDSEIENFNAIWRGSEASLNDDFPDDYLNGKKKLGFSIMDALNVLRLLSLLSLQYQKSYPENDEFKNINKLIEFCPKIKKDDLLINIKKATNYSFEKVSNIMKFIEYDGSNKKDLWCHPLILVKNRYFLITSSLVTPIILRVAEHWISSINKSMKNKGYVYEKKVIKSINDALKSNTYILSYNKAISKNIKINNKKEEIDLLIRIGKIIIIGEAKSIVTTDSAISQYRTVKILEKASAQIKRKKIFLEENIEAIFNNLEWDYDKNIDYKITPCIINSGRMYVGYEIDDVPVTDEIILNKYFSTNIIPCISDFDISNVNKTKHYAWSEVYYDFESMQNNIEKYIKKPPQIDFSLGDVEYKEIQLLYIRENSPKIIIKRLVKKDISLKDLLEKKQHFPLKTVKNIEEKIKSVQFTM